PWSSRAAMWTPNGPLLSWEGNESRYPSRVRRLHGDVLLRKHVPDSLDEARATRRDLLAVPPVLHGQAEAHGHGRPRRALPAPSGARGRQRAPRLAAETHGKRRRTGCPRGRNDAWPGELGRCSPHPLWRDRARLAADRLGDGAASLLPAARGARRDGA